MAKIGLMLEGQAGLTWARWERILQAAEDLGFDSVFRSDHFTIAEPDQESLEAWVSLTYAASHTKRIEFGPLVSPTTFRHPSITVRMAAALDDLSNGRFVFGLGAGWNEREHHQFGVPFYDVRTRGEMLRDALEVSTRLLKSDSPVSYTGEHFSLDGAILLPRPQRPGGPRILIGGNGMNVTLGLVAQFADEWNGVFIPPDAYRERNDHLNDLLAQAGRAPGSVRRSLMTEVIHATTDADLMRKLDAQPGLSEAEYSQKRIIGTTAQVVEKIGQYVEAGVERFMLQWLALDDLDGIEQLAKHVLPQIK